MSRCARLARAVARATTTTAAALASVVATVPAAYLGALTVVGVPRRRPRPDTGSAPACRFVILVPAHDEAAGIGESLESFHALDYPADQFQVHVVADNCTDDTVAVVRSHGWHAHERTAPDDPGKGPALNWLHDRLVEADERFDAVVVVDADTSLDREFLRAMDRAVRSGAVATQGCYSVRDPGASPSASFRFAALACRHHLRPLARNRLGASSGLYGNGMVFRREVLDGRRWTGHLVEDAEFQMELLLDGHLVTYVPDARLWAEMPDDVPQATSQNERWERGRLHLARRYVPVLLRRLFSDRSQRVAVADATLDHLVPPVSVLVAVQGLAAGLAAAGGATGSPASRRLVWLNLAAMVIVVAHTFAGLWAVRAPRHLYLNLVEAPRIVLWKARLWWSVARSGDDVAWTRTQRKSEVADG